MFVLDQIERRYAKRCIPFRKQRVAGDGNIIGSYFTVCFGRFGAGFLGGLLTACEYQAGGQDESQKMFH